MVACLAVIKIHGRSVPETLEEILEPKNTALVIHDMQNHPCRPQTPHSKVNGPIDCYRALPAVLTLRDAARRSGVQVMYTQYTNQPEWRSYSEIQLYNLRDRFGDPQQAPILTNVCRTWG